MEPCRARPVPFCRYGFLPPPATSPRVLVSAVPWRALACWATTAWCTTAWLGRMPKTRSSRSMVRTLVPRRSSTSVCMGLQLRQLADHDQATFRPGDGAPQRHDIAFGVDRQDAQVLDGHPLVAKVAGHAHVLEGAARGGPRAARARVPPAARL